jgi:serine phosphatase RsbU (regulator of sigma subunit)
MSIRLKTIFGIVLIQISALVVVVWANLDILSRSNNQMFDDQARAVATLTAQRAWSAAKDSREAFDAEIRLMQEADPRLEWIRILDEGQSVPKSTPLLLVSTVTITNGSGLDSGDRVVVALDRTGMQEAIDNALTRSIGIAVLEIVASIGFSLWLANWLLGRLTNLQMASRSIADGDFSRRVPVEGKDEIADTSAAFNLMASRLSELVERVRSESSRREAIEGELRIARQIQDALQPDACPLFPDHPPIEVEAVEDPIQEVAGDFYDWFAIDDRHLAIVIADVAGKGVPAGLFAAACLSVVRTLSRTGISPSQVLGMANEQLAERNREQMFASLSLLQMDPATGRINAAVAGHPAARIIRADGRLERALERTGPILGVIPGAEWTETSCVLETGDRLVLVTDGVLEARNEAGEMLEDDGFDKMLAAVGDVDSSQTARRIAWSVRTREGENPYDDLTVVVVRRLPPA